MALSEALALKDEEAKIAEVTKYYEAKGLDKQLLGLVSHYSAQAVSLLEGLNINEVCAGVLKGIIISLTAREL